ncbi:hypothetical protein BH10PAT4_BH10PAT4_3170 [soil metagenome]
MEAAVGGYSLAKRGVVTIANDAKIFVKIAEGDMTKKWLKKEILAYQKLNNAEYPFIPQLLAYNDDHSAMAIEYLEHANFDNIWDKDKLDAICNAQEELKKYKTIFINDSDFTLESVVGLDPKWPAILREGSLEKINKKFEQLGVDATFTRDQIESYKQMLADWRIADTTLVHQDIRADNFGYDTTTHQGKLIDWNWLCIGDESLDTTPLFINMYISGFDPYQFHPETYDGNMLAYLISFWLERVLASDQNENDLAFKRSKAQATSVKAAVELLARKPTR